MSQDTAHQDGHDWAALFYLCGHFNRADHKDPFAAALDEIAAVGATASMSAAVYLDLESGARRIALRPGEPADVESLGAVNSGDPQTLEQFLVWAFDACPARRYVLVMAGLGILDSDSVVGRPPFDSARTFAICDDRATDDAIELHELRATLRSAFPADGSRRLVLLACDMYAMQFMEVAYELRGVVDLLVGIQADAQNEAPPIRQWPYSQLLKRWQALVAAPIEGAAPRWQSGIDAHGVAIARDTIAMLAGHYGDATIGPTVSAINLPALAPLGQALDTFSVVYLQWLSNDVIWRAREEVVEKSRMALEHSWSYDLAEVAAAIQQSLDRAASEALARWAASSIPALEYPRLSRTLRTLGASARELARSGLDAVQAAGRDPGLDVFRALATEIAASRSAVERLIAVATSPDEIGGAPRQADVEASVRGLFTVPGGTGDVREPRAWAAIISHARDRFIGVQEREIADALDGMEAATQLRLLAGRVADLARGSGDSSPAVLAVWPPEQQCGVSLYRPVDLDKLAESNYLQLRFSRELHWTALLTAVDLIKNHAQMLWRLLESQLTAAPLEARYQLMRRLAGERALTGRHADQLRALSAPHALFLTIEPVDFPADGRLEGEERTARSDDDREAADPIVSYCVRLASLDRSSTVIEHRNLVTRQRLQRVLEEVQSIGSDVAAPPEETLARLARCGSLLGDDILYKISERLAEIEPQDDRPVHLVLQVPRDLMRYPWELLRDRRGWLVDRFAIGRQVIAEGDTAPRWVSSGRHGPLRLLVVAPAVAGEGIELAGAGSLEGKHVAASFARLQERLPGLVEPIEFERYVDRPVTVEEFRAVLRSERFDIVHFAGHGRYDAEHPERSCWMFSDGPLYAFELRHTLAHAEVLPWLIYGSACEGAQESGRASASHGYHDGVYGMASATLGQGVAAYLGPLWPISDTDAKNLAVAFYEALLLRRTSLGEALALARRSVRLGQPELDELVLTPATAGDDHDLPVSAGWTGMVLYGDPTPTVLQRLSPSDTSPAGHLELRPQSRRRRTSYEPLAEAAEYL
jgi:hypothetical protein